MGHFGRKMEVWRLLENPKIEIPLAPPPPLTLIRLGGGKVYPPSRIFSSVRAMSIRAPRATPHKKVNDMRQLLGEKKFQKFYR